MVSLAQFDCLVVVGSREKGKLQSCRAGKLANEPELFGQVGSNGNEWICLFRWLWLAEWPSRFGWPTVTQSQRCRIFSHSHPVSSSRLVDQKCFSLGDDVFLSGERN